MRIALSKLARPALAIALILTASAVGVSRLIPPPIGVRIPHDAGLVLISRPGLDACYPATLWLDPDTGRTTMMAPPEGGVIQRASLSPWLDETGRAQVAGLVSCQASDPRPDCCALIRATFPEGRVLDRVPLDALPMGRPCWYPGTRARVLFATGDGRLIQHAFESPAGRPSVLQWRCGDSFAEDSRILDPCWPSDPRFGSLVLASVRSFLREGDRLSLSAGRLSWLRLSLDGDAIEEVGPLLEGDSIADDLEYRSPSVGRAVGGGLVVAYFASADGFAWDLRLAPLTFDSGGRPTVAAGSATTLAGRCRPDIAPAFSGDGRWLSVAQFDGSGPASILRMDVASRVTAPPSPMKRWAPVVAAVQALFGLGEGHEGRRGPGARQGL